MHELAKEGFNFTTSCALLKAQVSNKPGTNGVLRILEPRKLTDGKMHSIARNYWITNESGVPENRGGHYHPYKSEIITVMRGQAKFTLKDNDNNCDRLAISTPNISLYIPIGIWHEVEIGGDCILSVLSPCEYHPDESIA